MRCKLLFSSRGVNKFSVIVMIFRFLFWLSLLKESCGQCVECYVDICNATGYIELTSGSSEAQVCDDYRLTINNWLSFPLDDFCYTNMRNITCEFFKQQTADGVGICPPVPGLCYETCINLKACYALPLLVDCATIADPNPDTCYLISPLERPVLKINYTEDWGHFECGELDFVFGIVNYLETDSYITSDYFYWAHVFVKQTMLRGLYCPWLFQQEQLGLADVNYAEACPLEADYTDFAPIIETTSRSSVRGQFNSSLLTYGCSENRAENSLFIDAYFFGLVLLTTPVSVFRRHHTPLKQRSMLLIGCLVLALCLLMGVQSHLRYMREFASCNAYYLFFGLLLPLPSFLLALRGFRLYALYREAEAKANNSTDALLWCRYYAREPFLARAVVLVVLFLVALGVGILVSTQNSNRETLFSTLQCTWWIVDEVFFFIKINESSHRLRVVLFSIISVYFFEL
jgi:hypothetical protein